MSAPVITIVDLRDYATVEGSGQVLSWLHDLSLNLRPHDVAEIAASSGHPPLDILIASVMDSELGFIVLHKDQPVCVFGACPVVGMEADVGIAWMLGSPLMDQRAVATAILRQTGKYVEVLQARFSTLWNWIDARNTRSMKWLRWSGFSIIGADPHHGLENRLFFQFVRKETHV